MAKGIWSRWFGTSTTPWKGFPTAKLIIDTCEPRFLPGEMIGMSTLAWLSLDSFLFQHLQADKSALENVYRHVPGEVGVSSTNTRKLSLIELPLPIQRGGSGASLPRLNDKSSVEQGASDTSIASLPTYRMMAARNNLAGNSGLAVFTGSHQTSQAERLALLNRIQQDLWQVTHSDRRIDNQLFGLLQSRSTQITATSSSQPSVNTTENRPSPTIKTVDAPTARPDSGVVVNSISTDTPNPQFKGLSGSESLPVANLTTLFGDAKEPGDSTPAIDASFEVTSTPSTLLSVKIELTGTAIFLVDYTIADVDMAHQIGDPPNRFTISHPKGVFPFTFRAVPLHDCAFEGTESVIITILPRGDYTVGASPANATIENTLTTCTLPEAFLFGAESDTPDPCVCDTSSFDGNAEFTSEVTISSDQECACGANPGNGLSHNSETREPNNVVQATISAFAPGSQTPATIDMSLSWDGGAPTTTAFSMSGVNINQPITLAMPTTGLTTGRHQYTVTLTSKNSGGSTLFTSNVTKTRYVVNSSGITNGDIYGGDGWSLGLTDRLINVAADANGPAAKLMWMGEGGFRVYEDPENDGTFVNNGPDRGKITTVGSTFHYLSPLGVREVFNSSGYQTHWVSADGAKTVTFVYDGSSRLQNVNWYDGTNSTLTYNGSGYLNQIISRYVPATLSGLGNTGTGQLATYTLGYNGSNQLTSLQMPDTRTWSFVYNGSGQLVETRIGSSASTGMLVNSYRYDSFGLLDKFRWGNLDSDTTGLNTYSFDPQWSRGLGAYYNSALNATVTDPLGRVTTYRFDKRGFMTSQVNPDGGVFTYVRDSVSSDLLQYIEPGPTGPLTTVYQYHAPSGFISRIDYPDGTNERFNYSLKTASNGVHGIERYVLDNYTNHIGTQIVYTYDAVGHPSQIQEDPSGINAIYNLNWFNPGVGQTTYPGTTAFGNLLSYTYSKDGITNHIVTNTYDTFGRLKSVRDAIGTYTYDYDDKGNLGRTTDRRNIPTTYTYDALHRVVNIRQPDPDGAGALTQWLGTFAYDNAGQLQSTVDPLTATTRRSATYSYDSRGLDTGMSELFFNGSVTTTLRNTIYNYDGAGQLTSLVDPRNNTTQYQYDSVGRLSTMTYAAGLGTVLATYSKNHWLNEMTDARGFKTSFTYTGRGWLQSQTEQGNAGTGDDQITSYLYVFDTGSKQLRVGATDPRNNTTTFIYDALDRITNVISPDPDGGGSLTSIINTYSYDKLGNLTQITHPRIISGPANVISTFSYDAVNRLIDQTIAANTTLEKNRSTFTYDAGDRLTSMAEAANNTSVLRTTTFAYDDLNRMTSQFEGKGQFTTTTLLRQTTFAYDAASRMVAMTYAANGGASILRTTTYSYDALDRMTGMTESVNNATFKRLSTYSYDNNDNLVSIADPLNRLTTYAYDARNRLSQITQPDPDAGGSLTSPITQYAYDGNSNLTSITNARNNITTYIYDPFNRNQQITQADPDGGGGLVSPLTTFSYDKSGNLITVADPLNHVTTYNYDNLNRVVSIVRPDPDGVGGTATAVTQFDYEQAGTLSVLTESPGLGAPLENRTTYVYDSLDRVKTESTRVAETTSVTNALVTHTYNYDTRGRLQSTVDANSRLVTFTYDALDRLTNEKWYSGAFTTTTLQRNTTYTYDLRDNLTDANHGTGNVRVTFTYDILDRVTETRQLIPAASGAALTTLVTSYSYFADDQVQARTSKINTTINNVTTYTYDGIGRVIDVKQTLNPSGSGNKQAVFTYLPTGELETIQRKGGTTFTDASRTTYTYDNMERTTGISTIQGANSYLYTYAYDAASRITREDSPDGAVTYSYYANNEISGADYSYRADETFQWDENGNPVGVGVVIGRGNRLLDDGAGNTYEYDKEGNRTKKTIGTFVTTYTWDQRNRLTGATTKNGATTTALGTFVYDAFNRRMATYVDPDGAGGGAIQPKRFWWDGDQVQAQLSNTTVTDRFLMGPGIDNVIADEKAGTIHWTLTDIRGSVREVVNSSGVSNTRKQYDAFGVKTDAVGTTDTFFGYTGREGEAAFGLQYNRNRWYDPAAKRFINEDPINGDVNTYRYAENQPTNGTDPYGLDIWINDYRNGSSDSFQALARLVRQLGERYGMNPGGMLLGINRWGQAGVYFSTEAMAVIERALQDSCLSEKQREMLGSAAEGTIALTLNGMTPQGQFSYSRGVAGKQVTAADPALIRTIGGLTLLQNLALAKLSLLSKGIWGVAGAEQALEEAGRALAEVITGRQHNQRATEVLIIGAFDLAGASDFTRDNMMSGIQAALWIINIRNIGKGIDGGWSLKDVGNSIKNICKDDSGALNPQAIVDFLSKIRGGLTPKIQKQMPKRGWTQDQLDEAITSGLQMTAINKATGNPATRFVHPKTKQSIVIDNVTGEIIHVGGPGFSYGIDSGDVPLLPK